MPKHRRSRGRRRPIVATVILVAMVGLTIRSIQQMDDPAADKRVDTAGTTTTDALSENAAPVQEVAGQGSKETRPDKKRVQTPTADTLPKSVCRPIKVDETITVLSYNIKYGAYGLTRVLSAIRAAEPDVVLLQEVDRFRARSRFVDMPTYLARELHMTAAFGANVSGGGGQNGTAILSRYPIEEEWNALLPNRRGGEQGGLLHAVLNVKGLRLSVYGTHLDKDQPVRIRQISAIKNVVADDPMPKLLGGDFNSQPRSPVLRIAFSVLDDPWAAGVGVGSPLTSPAARPRGRIDYLLHAGVALEPLRADVLATGASDHRAVRASYRLRGTAGSVCPDLPSLPDLGEVAADPGQSR